MACHVNFPSTGHRCVRAARALFVVAAFMGSVVPADAQSPDFATDKSELVRRGEAGESENGFCATVKFPLRTTISDFHKFLDGSKVGSEFVARSQYPTSSGCSFYRILAVTKRDGRECRETISWSCFNSNNDKGTCQHVERTWCRFDDGWNWLK